ncbi:MAG: hypothetical protein ABIP77_07225, partial [Candidatus Limnocylindrales bacterium]
DPAGGGLAVRRLILACSLLLILTMLPGASASAADGAEVYASTSRPLGASYVTWTERWFQWAFGTPVDTNPISHPEGCTTNLHGSVWYMPHTFVGSAVKTHCTIPKGTSILLAPGGALCDATEAPDTWRSLRSCADLTWASLYNFQVFIDGQELRNLEPFDVATPVFKISYPVNNLFDLRPGSYNAVATGRFVMLRPLTPGRHTIVVRDQSEDGTAQATAFLTVR